MQQLWLDTVRDKSVEITTKVCMVEAHISESLDIIVKPTSTVLFVSSLE